ncbi:MAG: prolipoprotein diacylglyceryl transferase [Breznakibacter sp.]
MLLNAITWNVDPEMFHLGPIHVRYYGLFFAVGFLLGYYIMERMFKYENLKQTWLDNLFVYVIVATVLGARLGHVFFYGWDYYSQHPEDILKIWEGGLASHGGAIGILIGIYVYSKLVTKKSPIWTLDRLVVPVALAGALIRLGNLMNHEIIGRPTDVPWAFKFIDNIHQWQQGAAPVYTVPSHPTQIYEALCYLAVFGMLMYLYWKTDARNRQGLLFGVFLVGVFSARFFIEFIKMNQEEFEKGMVLNMGQLLSIPFVVWGGWLLWNALRSASARK